MTEPERPVADWPQDEPWAQVAETHAAVVFLAGDRACKLKKPVNLGFLDFSTVEARAAACAREVELNRKFAPDVYLGVAEIRGPGQPGLRPPGGDAPHARGAAAVHAGPLAGPGSRAAAPGRADHRRPARQGRPQSAYHRAGQPRRAAPPLGGQHRPDPEDPGAAGAAVAARPGGHRCVSALPIRSVARADQADIERRIPALPLPSVASDRVPPACRPARGR